MYIYIQMHIVHNNYVYMESVINHPQAGLALIDEAHYAIAEIESKMTSLAAHWQRLMAKYVCQ